MKKLKQQKLLIDKIPAIIWGENSDKAYIFVHGKMSQKEYAADFAAIAEKKGYQTISFDLPEHGERKDENTRCDIWSGIADLTKIADYVYANWRNVSLYACSMGAYFSLNAYNNRKLENCLLQSPLVDMNEMINKMFKWFNVTPEQLEKQGEIVTDFDILSWKYYTFARENPISKWNTPTHILYGSLDNLQDADTVKAFAKRFGAELLISEGSEHPFMKESDFPIVKRWMEENI